MGEQLLISAESNPINQSVKQVVVAGLVGRVELVNNVYGDKLPIIPKESTVDDQGRVLFRLAFRVTVTNRATGLPVTGVGIRLKTSRLSDVLKASGLTDPNGVVIVTLETRESGELKIEAQDNDLQLEPVRVLIRDAWYESLFLITGYNVCAEDDFNGELVDGVGLNEKHKKDFLYSASGVPMQGTGKTADGKYIRLASMKCGWHRNAKGRPDYVEDASKITFAYAGSVMGAFAPVLENQSIAVDKRVIPKRASVEIEGVGKRSADDRGSAIKGFHIDNFLGAGAKVVENWLKGGVNGTHRKVKYLGS